VSDSDAQRAHRAGLPDVAQEKHRLAAVLQAGLLEWRELVEAGDVSAFALAVRRRCIKATRTTPITIASPEQNAFHRP
jgi:hypothetical protein